MQIHKGIKKIDPTNNDKNPLILVMQDTRKIIITKNNKKTENGTKKTYYSYQLNIPRDYILLIQDEFELMDNMKFLMYLLEIHKQHYIIKLAPNGVQNIYSLPNEYGYIGSGNFINSMMKKTNITAEQINQVINIVEQEVIRDKDKIITQISDNLNKDRKDAETIYDTYLKLEQKGKKNIQFTLPKKDMAYLQAYDKYQETVQNINNENEKHNKLVEKMIESKKENIPEKKPLFEIPPLYADMYFMQKFNVNGLYFEYELHININVDVDKSFVEYVQNDITNPGGIPGWLETLIIDWSDPVVQNHYNIHNSIKEYDLTDYGLTKYKIEKIEKNKGE